ncbi:MAG: hypothetical protein EXR98_04805 [Gemmataceae bacterium]|nr:hypothetical protein [Gemmataceae bacterium]
MNTAGRKGLILLAGLGLALLSGCQTYVMEAGINVPSGGYLRHTPQYFPPSDPFSLPKELRSLEDAAKKAADDQRQQ